MFVITAKNGRYDIIRCILSLIREDETPPVIMCLGNSFITGDNFGPKVGDLLIYGHNIRTFVYGCSKRPLTAKNAVSVFNFIRKTHKERILAIDAGLGKGTGNIAIYKGGITLASSYKNIPPIGDYSLICDLGSYFTDTVSTPFQRKKALDGIAEEIAAAVSDALLLYKACKLNTEH